MTLYAVLITPVLETAAERKQVIEWLVDTGTEHIACLADKKKVYWAFATDSIYVNEDSLAEVACCEWFELEFVNKDEKYAGRDRYEIGHGSGGFVLHEPDGAPEIEDVMYVWQQAMSEGTKILGLRSVV